MWLNIEMHCFNVVWLFETNLTLNLRWKTIVSTLCPCFVTMFNGSKGPDQSVQSDQVLNCLTELLGMALGPFSHVEYHMDCVKRKGVFKHARNSKIQIILRMRNVSSGHLLSFHTFCSIQWFCWRTVKTLIRLRGCAVWSGSSLSAYARKLIFAWRGQSTCSSILEDMILVETRARLALRNSRKDKIWLFWHEQSDLLFSSTTSVSIGTS